MMLPLAPDDGVTEPTEPGVLEAPRAERWGSQHPVNIRLSIPFFTRRYYLTVIAGTEQRSTERLANEREKHPLTTTANMIFLDRPAGRGDMALAGGRHMIAVPIQAV